MSSRTFTSVAALLAVGAIVACQGELPTSATGTSTPRASEGGFGAPVESGILMEGQFTQPLCGITVDVDAHQTGVRFVAEVGLKTRNTGSSRFLVTNPANGKAIDFRDAGPFTTEITSIDPDGTLHVTETSSGLSGQIQDADGGPILQFNAGHAVVSGYVTPLPGGGSEGTITSITLDGPHPAMNNSPEQCAVIRDALL